MQKRERERETNSIREREEEGEMKLGGRSTKIKNNVMERSY